jgi:hypothetical protein
MMSSSYTNLIGAGWAVNGVPLIPNVSGIPLTGNWFFVDPANGSDGNPGTGDAPLATLYRAHALCTSGNNDVVVLVSNGASTGSARLSTALAQTIDSSATTGTLVWSKNACHLIGAGAPTVVSQRARIAPPTGTYTQATFGSGNFVSVTGSGCIFSNFSLFNGFSTGGTNQICWTDTGGRNYYNGVDFGGMGDAASANSTGSRSLKISTAGENTFVNCTIGLDTVTRTAANASLEFSGGTARNTFRNCIFPFQGNTAGILGVTVAAASGIDRWQIFDNCSFINNVQSTSTTMSGLSTLVASSGGLLLVQNSRMVGITEWGTDATSRGQIYVDMSAPDAAAGGVTTNPT